MRKKSMRRPAEMAERKSYVVGPSLFDGLLIQSGAYAQLSFLQALNMYLSCSPLFNAVDRLASECAKVRPAVYDAKADTIIHDHPIFELLESPNPTMDGTEFIYAAATWLTITGNAFPYALGKTSRPPAELWLSLPHFVTASPDSVGQPLQFKDRGFMWTRKEDRRRWRFTTDDDLSELHQIKTFVPGVGGSQLFGISSLTSMYMEIEQYNYGNMHNLSLLKRGARPSAIFSVAGELSDSQYTRLQEQVNQFYVGAHNAGRPFLGEGGMDVKLLSQTNKDMDFMLLKAEQRDRIYTTLKIPLSLVSKETMTYDNMENGTLALYEQAVLPLYNKLMASISRWLMPRYSGSERLTLVADERSISALRYRRMVEAEKMSKVYVFSDNEIRNAAGYEDTDAGDAIYKPTGVIAVSEDSDLSNPPPDGVIDPDGTKPKPNSEPEEVEDEPPVDSAVEKFRRLLGEQKTSGGAPLYDEAGIEAAVAKHFGV